MPRIRGSGRFFLFICPLLLLLACSEAPLVPLVPTNRVVLTEFFTYQRCSYCPYAARTLESLALEFPDNLIIIAYHRRFADDTLSPEYVETRRQFYYQSGGEPATVFDGGEVVRTPGPEYNYETFRNHILGAKSVLPGAELKIGCVVDSNNILVRVQVSGVDATPAETLSLFLVLTEDSLQATLPGAADSVFNNVMRAMLPDVRGQPVWVARGDTVGFENRVSIGDNWRLERLRAVAFVQQMSTKKVLQSAVARVITRR